LGDFQQKTPARASRGFLFSLPIESVSALVTKALPGAATVRFRQFLPKTLDWLALKKSNCVGHRLKHVLLFLTSKR
jgi:hypothetical protein